MKKTIVKEFITVKKVRHLPRPPTPPPKRLVMCVGVCILDIITNTPTYPQEDIKVEITKGEWMRGGSSSIMCTVLRRLGMDCEFLGMLSSVSAFECLTNDCTARGIIIENCPRTVRPPPFSMVITTDDKSSTTFVHANNKFPIFTHQHFLSACDFRKYRWIHFEMGVARHTKRMLQDIRAYNERRGDNIITSLDLSNLYLCNLKLAELVDYVFVRSNIQEKFSWMTGHETCRRMRDIINVARRKRKMEDVVRLVDNWKEEDEEKSERLPIIIFRGNMRDEGASCVDANDRFIQVAPPPKSKVVDTLGDSETFIAAFIYALNELNLHLRDSLEYATRTYGFKVSHHGLDVIRCMPKTLLGFYYN